MGPEDEGPRLFAFQLQSQHVPIEGSGPRQVRDGHEGDDVALSEHTRGMTALAKKGAGTEGQEPGACPLMAGGWRHGQRGFEPSWGQP